MVYLQSLPRRELEALLYEWNLTPQRRDESDEAWEKRRKRVAALRARQVFTWFYKRLVVDYDQMTDLSKELREVLKERLPIYRLEKHVEQQSQDGTYKFLWKLQDQRTIESVIIPAALTQAEEVGETPRDSHYAGRKVRGAGLTRSNWKRLTACISSQVGCAMACRFCLTGVQGLDRNLQTHEIVTQILELRLRAPVTNIVFMGMGEPLHNFENVVKAIEIFLDEIGFDFSKRKVTVSTSGLVPKIRELSERVDVSLAISLNGSNDEQREKVMPVNKRWPIAELLQACREYSGSQYRRITFEYVMLKDINDSLEDAARVVKLLRGIPAKVNLIPFNEHPGADFKRAPDERVKAFQKYLLDRELFASVRVSRGRDILAACGQLRSLFGTARGTEKHRDFVKSESSQA